jgi:hypothetical protein
MCEMQAKFLGMMVIQVLGSLLPPSLPVHPLGGEGDGPTKKAAESAFRLRSPEF